MSSDSDQTDEVGRRIFQGSAEQEVAAAVRRRSKPISSLPAVCFASRELAFNRERKIFGYAPHKDTHNPSWKPLSREQISVYDLKQENRVLKKIAVEQIVERKLLECEKEELEGKVEEWKREAGSVLLPSPPPSPPRSALPGFWRCPAPECWATSANRL